LQPGDAVFLDANTFIYHSAPDPVLGPPCSQLLQRIENQDLLGFTSLHLLPEIAHKMMTTEANARLGWPFRGMANRLRRHPAEVQKLTGHRLTIDRIAHSRVQVLPFTVAQVLGATAASQQYGLLTNDALIVAILQANGLSKIASHDADFDRVAGIARYSPV
jgi:predicted nucleic acid-binding protein